MPLCTSGTEFDRDAFCMEAFGKVLTEGAGGGEFDRDIFRGGALGKVLKEGNGGAGPNFIPSRAVEAAGKLPALLEVVAFLETPLNVALFCVVAKPGRGNLPSLSLLWGGYDLCARVCIPLAGLG